MSTSRLASSFRDPSGFMFIRQDRLYRQINRIYQPHYDQLMGSGLYDELVRFGLLIPHRDVSISAEIPDEAYKIIEPERIAFVSYPYEWSFSQIKDAALTTLDVQWLAMKHGMSLKDASAYNIQFHQGRPVLIDTLSFEPADMTRPWVAYRQFCQHFLAPLALMSHTDHRLSALLRIYMDGLPLDLTSRLLPLRTRFSFSLLSHIHLHARSQLKHANSPSQNLPRTLERRISPLGFRGLISSLRRCVSTQKRTVNRTEWARYYEDTNYSDQAGEEKARIIGEWLENQRPLQLWDLGANIGRYTRLASQRGVSCLSIDIDPLAVEYNYEELKKNNETNLLPLLIDLTNPSPSMGWAHRERDSLADRGPVDMVMALALVHHLAISNNLPLRMVASCFSRLCHNLIIEFVPKEDSQVKRLLASRQDVFPDYHREGFEAAFETEFKLMEARPIAGSDRTLYLYRKKCSAGL